MFSQLKNQYDNFFVKQSELFKELTKLLDNSIENKNSHLYELLDIFKLYIINIKNESSIYQLIRPMNVSSLSKLYTSTLYYLLNFYSFIDFP